jgi:uncharacterized YigZ family protein
MTESQRYPVPAKQHRVEERIKQSRFITTVARAETAEAAHGFIDRIREEFGDATHNCWAFVAGPPGSTADVGMSDDGEPHGTAGRPMLEALLHADVGEVVAVVTRYYGGVKLGKGGLQRAYSGGVQKALASLPVMERVHRSTVWVAVEYAQRDPMVRLAEQMDAVLVDEEYGADVRLKLAVPSQQLGEFRHAVADVTGGKGLIEPG